MEMGNIIMFITAPKLPVGIVGWIKIDPISFIPTFVSLLFFCNGHPPYLFLVFFFVAMSGQKSIRILSFSTNLRPSKIDSQLISC